VPSLYHVDGAAKVRAFGPPAALDALATPAGSLRGRIASNELVLVGAPGTAGALDAHCGQALRGYGSSALVVDHTDGWTFFTLTGDGLEEVFARVSHLPLPAAGAEPVFFMGRIADVAAKAFRRPGRVDVMTGTEASLHVRERFEHVGHAFGLRVVAAPENALGVEEGSA
jgi:hypothetical protein